MALWASGRPREIGGIAHKIIPIALEQNQGWCIGSRGTIAEGVGMAGESRIQCLGLPVRLERGISLHPGSQSGCGARVFHLRRAWTAAFAKVV